MIKLLIKLGKWLETRFPEKHVVTPAEYVALLERVANLEANSVHKDAVKDLVLVVKAVKDEFQTVKTGLGLNSPKASELMAMLNGHPISQGDE